MVEICLSVAPILRCQSLTRLQSGILLLPPGLETIFAVVLLFTKRGSDRKDVFIATEIFIYFILAVLDVLSHNVSAVGSSIIAFKSIDIVVGVGSFIPLFLYAFALYFLTSTDFIPNLPVRFQNIAKYVLLAFIPLIALFNELASFVGITYRSFAGNGTPVLGVGFTNDVARTFLTSVTLVLLTLFQATNFCTAFYRLMKALSHQRTLEQSEKQMETHLFRGLGWIVAGTKLGAIETVIGFVQGGFGIAIARRLFRLLSRACLIIGLIKGVDTVEDFQLYSPGESQKRRKSMLRAMIQNPRFSTFRHVGGHDLDKPSPHEERRQSVIRLGDPSWMRRDYTPGLIDENRASPALGPKRKSALTFLTNPINRRSSNARNSGSSFGSTRRSSHAYVESPRSEYQDVDDDDQADVPEVDVSGVTVVPRKPHPSYPSSRQRVTVHIRKDRLPVLELRRFSNLEFLDLIQDPFRDPHTRSYSLPILNRLERSSQPPPVPLSASMTRLPAYHGPSVHEATPPPLPTSSVGAVSTRESVASVYSRGQSSHGRLSAPRGALPRSSVLTFGLRASVSSYDPRVSNFSEDEESPSASATSFHATSPPSPRAATASGQAPEAGPPAQLTDMSRRDRGLSSSTTVSEVHAIALQFPGIPMRPQTLPARRSMLSHQVSRGFLANAEEPLPARAEQTQPLTDGPQPSFEVARVPSFKRKPAPLMTEGLADARIQSVEIEQGEDEDDDGEAAATRSLPIPQSAPRLVHPRPRAHSAPRIADVASTPSENGSFDAREVEVVRPAAIVRRNAEQGRLVRVKSVGSAPRREVSAAHRTAFTRDSMKVELGVMAREGKLAAVTRRREAGAGAERDSVVSIAEE